MTYFQTKEIEDISYTVSSHEITYGGALLILLRTKDYLCHYFHFSDAGCVSLYGTFLVLNTANPRVRSGGAPRLAHGESCFFLCLVSRGGMKVCNLWGSNKPTGHRAPTQSSCPSTGLDHVFSEHDVRARDAVATKAIHRVSLQRTCARTLLDAETKRAPTASSIS